MGGDCHSASDVASTVKGMKCPPLDIPPNACYGVSDLDVPMMEPYRRIDPSFHPVTVLASPVMPEWRAEWGQ